MDKKIWKLTLDAGLNDVEDVEAECRKCMRGVREANWTVEEEGLRTKIILTSPYKFELQKFTEHFLGEFRGLARSFVDEDAVEA